jgi:hypothetical protein
MDAWTHGRMDAWTHGRMDAWMYRGSDKFIMAVYFPHGQKSFSEIKKKFSEDIQGVTMNAAAGIAFVTNQELKLAERRLLRQMALP